MGEELKAKGNYKNWPQVKGNGALCLRDRKATQKKFLKISMFKFKFKISF